MMKETYERLENQNCLLYTLECFKCSLYKVLTALYQHLYLHIIWDKLSINQLT